MSKQDWRPRIERRVQLEIQVNHTIYRCVQLGFLLGVARLVMIARASVAVLSACFLVSRIKNDVCDVPRRPRVHASTAIFEAVLPNNLIFEAVLPNNLIKWVLCWKEASAAVNPFLLQVRLCSCSDFEQTTCESEFVTSETMSFCFNDRSAKPASLVTQRRHSTQLASSQLVDAASGTCSTCSASSVVRSPPCSTHRSQACKG